MEIQENIPLAPYTTLRIGGPARFFTRLNFEDDLVAAIQFARANHLPTFVLGGGSNLLVPDEGYPGMILNVAIDGSLNISGLTDSRRRDRRVTYDVPAGFDWDAFVRITCEARFTGVECLAGIPGMTGGTPVQNVGAYGQEVAQTITLVRVLDLETLHFRNVPVDECGFAYRRSIFNSTHRNRYIVTRVSFRFSIDEDRPNLTYADLAPLRDQNPTPLDVYHFVRQIRDRKGMLIDSSQDGQAHHADSRSAGSFFKNPVVPPTALATIANALTIPESDIPRWPTPSGELKLPAAWLIERAGFPKGFSLGPVGISSRHTLALVNRTATATCADRRALRALIITTVRDRCQITLEQDPVFLK